MSFLSSPSRTHGHPLPPLHREVFSATPAAVQAALQAGESAGSPDVSHGRQTSGGGENWPQALRQEGTHLAGDMTPVRYSILALTRSPHRRAAELRGHRPGRGKCQGSRLPFACGRRRS